MKCSNHPDKDVAAVCERCNLFYCGNCVLSSNGKCPKCGNTLRSPQSVMSYEISKSELYKGKGQPHLEEAINSLYMEPVRAVRRLKEYASLFSGVINITILYLIVTLLRILAIVFITLILTPEVNFDPISALFDAKNIFAFLMGTIIYYGVFVFGWLFSSFIYFLPAKLIGGKGEFVQHAFVFSYLMIALLPLWVASLVLAAIPNVGFLIAFVITIVAFFYSVFLLFLTIREINEFSTFKAIVSLLISIGVSISLFLMLSLVLVLIFAMPLIGNLPHPSF